MFCSVCCLLVNHSPNSFEGEKGEKGWRRMVEREKGTQGRMPSVMTFHMNSFTYNKYYTTCYMVLHNYIWPKEQANMYSSKFKPTGNHFLVASSKWALGSIAQRMIKPPFNWCFYYTFVNRVHNIHNYNKNIFKEELQIIMLVMCIILIQFTHLTR